MNKIKYLKYLKDYKTRIIELKNFDQNAIYIKREDDIPYSFGGNKVRIVCNYLIDALEKGSDSIVTYGSSSSNLCRILAGLCEYLKLRCIIISPEEKYTETTNSVLVSNLNAKIIKSPLVEISETIDRVIKEESGKHKPYFIYGGGHGVIGTDSYRNVYKQIIEYEKTYCISFDRIFITCATGTSLSGLIIESAINERSHKIYGITIAREKQKVVEIMDKALLEYCDEYQIELARKPKYEILDSSRCFGYGLFDQKILDTIKNEFIHNGLNLDCTYTGKGYSGMLDYIQENNIKGENILFVYTGGTPLFFNNNCEWIKSKRSDK